MDSKTTGRPSPLLPWALGIVFAAIFCSSYFLMFAYRQVWKSHYPALADRWANNGRFSVVGLYGTELMSEELLYASRVKEASEHILAYDPYIKENRSRHILLTETVSYSIMGFIQKVTGDVSWTWVATRFLCCLGWFILLYHLTMRLGTSSELAFFSAAFVTGFSYLLTFLFVSQLSWQGGPLSLLARNAWTILSYGRTEGILRLPRPGLIYVFSFLAALWNVKAAEEKKSWKWAILSGLMGGLLALVRLEVWTTYILASSIFACLLTLKNRFEWRYFVPPIIAGVLSLPYLYYNYPPPPDFLLRLNVFYQRTFDPTSLCYLLAFFAAARFKKTPTELFLSSVMASVFLMVNIELLLGYQIYPFHWKYLGNIYFFLLLISFLPERVKKMRRPWIVASGVAAFILLFQSVGYSAIHFPFSGIPRDYDEAFKWMQRNTPAESVVLTLNPEVDMLIPAFTENKVFISNAFPHVSDYPMISNAERLLAGLSLLDADKERFFNECLFVADKRDRHDALESADRTAAQKTEVYSMIFLLTPRPKTREILAQAAGHESSAQPDYLWFGPFEKEYAGKAWPIRLKADWEEVYRNGSTTLYRRKKSVETRAD